MNIPLLRRLRSIDRDSMPVPSSVGLGYFVAGYEFVDRSSKTLTEEASRRVVNQCATPSGLDAGSAIYMLEQTDNASYDRFLSCLEECSPNFRVSELPPNTESVRGLVSSLRAKPILFLANPDVRFLRCFIDGFMAAKEDLEIESRQDRQDMLAFETRVQQIYRVYGRWERILYVLTFPDEQIKTFCDIFHQMFQDATN